MLLIESGDVEALTKMVSILLQWIEADIAFETERLAELGAQAAEAAGE
jgi:hypothetical protein